MTTNSIAPAVGQVWRSTDPRDSHVKFRILRFEWKDCTGKTENPCSRLYVIVQRLDRLNNPISGSRPILAERLKPGERGYKLDDGKKSSGCW